MKSITNYFIIIFLYIVNPSSAQMAINALRIDEKINIDGKGDEAIWNEAQVAGNFVVASPTYGNKPDQKTEVKILYDDEALYVKAEMSEIARDSIMTQLTQRDNLGNTDAFGIWLDTYGNGTDGVLFGVGATGVQLDALKSNSGNEDDSWDAVWFSDVELRDDGWTVEVKLPYSALRFSKEESQEWVINFIRIQARTNEASTWSPIDPEINGVFTQSGKLTNIKDITPPVRLSFSPYFSTYAQHNHNKIENPVNSLGYTYNGGMDVKYGINDAFTLDMTLVPDFGQVESDDNVVNLSPFEVRFDEKRPFFTEGVELFNKADIFYTRRIGGQPIKQSLANNEVGQNEVLISNPSIPQLYNATKISGRNSNGLAIGVFNALEASTNAIIRNTENNQERTYKTQPLTNYNVLVLDQNLKNNSSVSLINTNVWRKGKEFYDANVTGLEFSLKDKNQDYEIEGVAAYSALSIDKADNITGHKAGIEISKISGKIRYDIEYYEESPDYDPNDLGFLRAANERSIEAGSSYNIFEPFGIFNRAEFWVNAEYSRIIDPDAYTGFRTNVGLWMQTKNFWSINMWSNYSLTGYDYFEPREPGRYVERPTFYNTGIFIGSDNRKKFWMGGRIGAYNLVEEGRWGYHGYLNPRYRFNDNFTMYLETELDMQYDDTGWVDNGSSGEIYLGQRDRLRVINLTGFNYNFSEKIGLEMRVRHYWERTLYQSYHELTQDGLLGDTDYSPDNDFDFTFFNIDLNFNWRFAPGSDIFINWKNNIQGGRGNSTDMISEINYFSGLRNITQLPQINSLSVRVVYYIDYLNLKKII